MKRLILALTIVALATPLFAVDVFVPLSQTEGLLIKAPGASSITAKRIPIQSIGTVIVTPGPVTPDPVVPVVGTLAETVAAALATVPTYANRDNHRGGIAFVMQFLSQGAANKPVIESMAIVRQGCNSVTGADSAKWSTFWSMLDAKTRTMTPSGYGAALPIIAETLTSDLASSGEDFKYAEGPIDIEGAFAGEFSVASINGLMANSGANRYAGFLPEGFLAELMKILLPLLLKMLLGI